MSVDLERRRTELIELRTRVLGAAQDIVEGDEDQSELSSAAGDQPRPSARAADPASNPVSNSRRFMVSFPFNNGQCAVIRSDRRPRLASR